MGFDEALLNQFIKDLEKRVQLLGDTRREAKNRLAAMKSITEAVDPHTGKPFTDERKYEVFQANVHAARLVLNNKI